jgi:hypothetical protein
MGISKDLGTSVGRFDLPDFFIPGIPKIRLAPRSQLRMCECTLLA